jgi:diguanylate cyclase (GGDEF)-like protein/PAS domain S-box-containing protein
MSFKMRRPDTRDETALAIIVRCCRAHGGAGLILPLTALVAFNIALFLNGDMSPSAAISAGIGVLGLVGTMFAFDVADRERMAARAHQDQARSFRTMLEEHFLLISSDKDGRFLDANDIFLTRIGYTKAELSAKPADGLCSGHYSSEYISEMWSAVSAGKTWSGEFRDRAKDGSYVWVKAVVVPVRDGNGRTETIMTIGVDVSDQHNAEEELKRAAARHEAFIKHAPAAVAMFDNEMRYVAHTDRWLQDYSLKPQSLIGRGHYDVFPEIPQHWRDKHQRILKGATERCDEERFLRADGTENILRWEVRPWYLPDDSVGGIMMLTEEISERKRLEDELWKLAKLDNLTALPNRLLFTEHLERSIEKTRLGDGSFGLALIDLDRFKEINDTLGHDAGDELLKVTAARLTYAIGNLGTVSRLGGDEFAVLVSQETAGDTSIAETISAIEDALTEPVDFGGVPRHCAVSIGVSVFPQDADEPGDLLKNADLALYRAKNLGRSRTEFFAPEMRESMLRKVELEHGAVDALERDEFVLYYQPVISTDTTSPPSFEALLRWRHPTRGIMAPGLFEEVFDIPKVAFAIGERVLDMAMQQIAFWDAERFNFERVAINVSTADFSFGCYASRVEKKLAEYKLPPSRLCVEVTERVFLDSGSAEVGEALEKLHELGVEIALDDFGTGFASLSHIKAFPIDRLKIDRSFVHDMHCNKDNLSIVQAITQLGRSLGLSVTAEGVEIEEQLVLLRSLGCASIQGYIYMKPIPAIDIPGAVPKRMKEVALVA